MIKQLCNVKFIDKYDNNMANKILYIRPLQINYFNVDIHLKHLYGIFRIYGFIIGIVLMKYFGYIVYSDQKYVDLILKLNEKIYYRGSYLNYSRSNKKNIILQKYREPIKISPFLIDENKINRFITLCKIMIRENDRVNIISNKKCNICFEKNVDSKIVKCFCKKPTICIICTIKSYLHNMKCPFCRYKFELLDIKFLINK